MSHLIKEAQRLLGPKYRIVEKEESELSIIFLTADVLFSSAQTIPSVVMEDARQPGTIAEEMAKSMAANLVIAYEEEVRRLREAIQNS